MAKSGCIHSAYYTSIVSVNAVFDMVDGIRRTSEHIPDFGTMVVYILRVVDEGRWIC